MFSSPDHPRSRGVYRRALCRVRRSLGSSPLARGLLRLLPCHVGPLRIIPARAGFTASSICMTIPQTDHPRSRGVYGRAFPLIGRWRGSSPLARGLQWDIEPCGKEFGIIPARAGFTCMLSTLSRATLDHPRSRGVYRRTRGRAPNREGSSPLARGLLGGHLRLRLRPGIIPARAGFTRILMRIILIVRDHPRSRGVYRGPLAYMRGKVGSSPLARGLPPPVTGAETTSGDHPRSRGVYPCPVRTRRPSPGSSPLARGLRVDKKPAEATPGIIPARAGFTGRRSVGLCGHGDHPRSRGVYCPWNPSP